MIPLTGRHLCLCGCGRPGVVLATGTDYDGTPFVDEPMCKTAAEYVSEAAYLCKRDVTFREIPA